MASSSPPEENEKLGDELVNVGKTLNASATVQKIASEMVGVKEDLQSMRRESEKFNFNGPDPLDFLRALDESIDFADGLCGIAKSLSEKHSECVGAFMKMTHSKEITPEQVDTMTTNLNGILQLCVDFEKKLNEFMESLSKARDQAEKVSNEAKKEEERLKLKAAATRSEAKLKSVGLWAARIFSFGLITLSSGFQDAAARNDERYRDANRMEILAQKFRNAHRALDMVAKNIDKIRDRVQAGPIKLTKEMIDVIKHVMQLYAQWIQMKQENTDQKKKLLERENTIEQQNAALSEKDTEIANLKAMLAAQKKSS